MLVHNNEAGSQKVYKKRIAYRSAQSSGRKMLNRTFILLFDSLYHFPCCQVDYFHPSNNSCKLLVNYYCCVCAVVVHLRQLLV